MPVYRCEVHAVLYVLAEDQHEARHIAERHAEEELAHVDVEEARQPDDGWADDSLVYHAGREDITLREAFERAERGTADE